ncbi:Hypothetical predicted protein, partial [Olea europaea subsp. europaea]
SKKEEKTQTTKKQHSSILLQIHHKSLETLLCVVAERRAACSEVALLVDDTSLSIHRFVALVVDNTSPEYQYSTKDSRSASVALGKDLLSPASVPGIKRMG